VKIFFFEDFSHSQKEERETDKPSNKPSFSSERRSPSILIVGSKLKEEEEDEDEIVDKNMAFVAPQCRDDEDGWGPTSKGYGKEDGETGIEAIIYSPFLKTDKFGRAADWTTSGGKYNRNEQRYQREREMQHKRDFGGGGVVQSKQQQGGGGGGGGGGGSQQQGGEQEPTSSFNFFENKEEEGSFSLVDTSKGGFQQKKFGGQQRRFQPGGGRGFGRGRGAQDQSGALGDQGIGAERERARQMRKQSKKQQQWSSWGFNRNDRNQVSYDASVEIKPTWNVVEQIQLSAFAKVTEKIATPTDAPETLKEFGALKSFDKTIDRITPKTERTVKRLTQVSSLNGATASKDPVMVELGKANASANPNKVTLMTTDTTLAAIMCATRSVFGWDVVITKKGNTITFDKRPRGVVDSHTVSETAQEAISDDKDNINGAQKLAEEATLMSAAYSAQVASEEPEVVLGGERKVPVEDAPSGVAYRYRKWQLNDKRDAIVRTEVNGVTESRGQNALLCARALLEYDSKVSQTVDWRAKIETQRGAVIATELKNNSNKLAKWTCCAILAGADLLKLGFVSRVHPKDPNAHSILNTQTFKPKDFAAQINLNYDNIWGALGFILDVVEKQVDGTYILVKDPNKPQLRMYKVPDDYLTYQFEDQADEELDI
jgi:translation initiation factor 3 subunit D|tara:strand:- start:4233 stop:6203 length:1971 start_codon:yes stop_codon:yes gene_type:complete